MIYLIRKDNGERYAEEFDHWIESAWKVKKDFHVLKRYKAKLEEMFVEKHNYHANLDLFVDRVTLHYTERSRGTISKMRKLMNEYSLEKFLEDSGAKRVDFRTLIDN